MWAASEPAIIRPAPQLPRTCPTMRCPTSLQMRILLVSDLHYTCRSSTGSCGGAPLRSRGAGWRQPRHLVDRAVGGAVRGDPALPVVLQAAAPVVIASGNQTSPAPTSAASNGRCGSPRRVRPGCPPTATMGARRHAGHRCRVRRDRCRTGGRRRSARRRSWRRGTRGSAAWCTRCADGVLTMPSSRPSLGIQVVCSQNWYSRLSVSVLQHQLADRSRATSAARRTARCRLSRPRMPMR